MPGGDRGRVALREMRKKDLFRRAVAVTSGGGSSTGRETLEYLRAANALDESVAEPVVLVPNYMSLGPTGAVPSPVARPFQLRWNHQQLSSNLGVAGH
eukprot:Skav234036  [mRNA]  locus=scaffold5814:25595:27496:- [translate_table: standard]